MVKKCGGELEHLGDDRQTLSAVSLQKRFVGEPFLNERKFPS
jgi:hypothetical protein